MSYLGTDRLIFIGVGSGGRGNIVLKKKTIQDPILSEKNIQDRGKRCSTLCIRRE